MAFNPGNASQSSPAPAARSSQTPKVGRINLKNVRLSFPHLFKPKAVSEGGKATYSATFLIPKDTPEGVALAREVQASMAAVARELWGENIPKLKSEKLCLRDGDDETWDGYENCFYVNARNPNRVQVVDRNLSPIVESDDKLYGGCYVNGVITIWAQNNSYGQRINATLEAVQFVRDGDPFGSKKPSASEFFSDLSSESDGALAGLL